MKRLRNEKGFTLIELLVVIVILGILAAVVVFAVGGLNDKGDTSACKIDTRTLKTAQEAHFAKEPTGGKYATEQGLVDANLLDQLSSLHDIQYTAADPDGADNILADNPGTAGVDESADNIPNDSYKVFVADTSNSAAADKCGTAVDTDADGVRDDGPDVDAAANDPNI